MFTRRFILRNGIYSVAAVGLAGCFPIFTDDNERDRRPHCHPRCPEYEPPEPDCPEAPDCVPETPDEPEVPEIPETPDEPEEPDCPACDPETPEEPDRIYSPGPSIDHFLGNLLLDCADGSSTYANVNTEGDSFDVWLGAFIFASVHSRDGGYCSSDGEGGILDTEWFCYHPDYPDNFIVTGHPTINRIVDELLSTPVPDNYGLLHTFSFPNGKECLAVTGNTAYDRETASLAARHRLSGDPRAEAYDLSDEATLVERVGSDCRTLPYEL